jgi:hypothetical protein
VASFAPNRPADVRAHACLAKWWSNDNNVGRVSKQTYITTPETLSLTQCTSVSIHPSYYYYYLVHAPLSLPVPVSHACRQHKEKTKRKRGRAAPESHHGGVPPNLVERVGAGAPPREEDRQADRLNDLGCRRDADNVKGALLGKDLRNELEKGVSTSVVLSAIALHNSLSGPTWPKRQARRGTRRPCSSGCPWR